MASVRMTNELRSNIHNRAMEAFATARPTPRPSTWLTDRMRDAVLQSEPYQTLKEMHARQGLKTFRSLGGVPGNINKEDCSHISISSQRGFTEAASNNTTLHFEFVPSIPLYRGSSWGTPEFIFEELPPQSQADLRKSCYDLGAEIRDWYAQKQTYEQKIRDLLEQCTTVKQMLTAWPAGESFVPNENKRRMYEKVTRIERAQRIKEEVQFDDALVNQVVLTAKLVGG